MSSDLSDITELARKVSEETGALKNHNEELRQVAAGLEKEFSEDLHGTASRAFASINVLDGAIESLAKPALWPSTSYRLGKCRSQSRVVEGNFRSLSNEAMALLRKITAVRV